MSKAELLALLWAIFIAEGDCKASVPFGYIKRKADWKARKVGFVTIMNEVIGELKLEYRRFRRAVKQGKFDGDFIRWLARVGYNANPAEWDAWEQNVRHHFERLMRV